MTARVASRALMSPALVPAALLLLAGAANSGAATQASDSEGWLSRTAGHLAGIARDGQTEVFLPFLTYHFRFAYTPEQINSYEESPLGFGLGRGRFLADGNWAGLYAMGFQDSHSKPQWLAGYGWQKIWRTPPGIRLGLGYTAFLSARTDYNHYQPFPVILPLASIGYREVSVETAYVPGGTGFGNILFFWAKWRPDHKESP